jgi:GR25 family glycosyltransferase involved in LPS biosynthesis
MNSIQDIQHAFYINLESRPDRKKHIEQQLNLLGINADRFNAIKLPNGALGCSMSHLKCLEIAKQNNWPHLLIIEDDILFLNHKLFKKQLNTFLTSHKEWDVILIGGNNVPPYTKIDETCVKVSTCQTTTGYLVNAHYFDTLIQNFRTGIKKLIQFPDLHKIYAIDKFWFSLQQRDNWFLITPLTVIQREGFSDIENKKTNYSSLLLDLNKDKLLKKIKK